MEDRVEAVEKDVSTLNNSVKVLMELVSNRRIIKKDSETQTIILRKNITERGNQIKPKTKETGVNTQRVENIQKIDSTIQTEKTISIADILLRKITERLLPKILMMNLERCNAENKDELHIALENIQNNVLNTEDVVLLCEYSLDRVCVGDSVGLVYRYRSGI